MFISVFIGFQIKKKNTIFSFLLRYENFFKMVFIENQPLKGLQFPWEQMEALPTSSGLGMFSLWAVFRPVLRLATDNLR